MRQELSEIKELSEVVRDLASLVAQMVSEKRQLQASLRAELELREQIESALERQEEENLSPDLLIMKIKTLEHGLRQLTACMNEAEPNTKSYSVFQSVKVFNAEVLDDKIRLVERVRVLEAELKQAQEDVESLAARVAESEAENVELKL